MTILSPYSLKLHEFLSIKAIWRWYILWWFSFSFSLPCLGELRTLQNYQAPKSILLLPSCTQNMGVQSINQIAKRDKSNKQSPNKNNGEQTRWTQMHINSKNWCKTFQKNRYVNRFCCVSTLYSEVVAAVGKNWYRNEMWIWLSHEINHDLIGCKCLCLCMCLSVCASILRCCQLKNELLNKIDSNNMLSLAHTLT